MDFGMGGEERSEEIPGDQKIEPHCQTSISTYAALNFHRIVVPIHHCPVNLRKKQRRNWCGTTPIYDKLRLGNW